MKKVLLLTAITNPIARQIPQDLRSITNNYTFEIKDKYSSGFDYIVILDDFQRFVNLNFEKNKVVLFTGEPPTVKIYPKKFLNQFGAIFTCQTDILKRENAFLTIPPLAWMTGCSFIQNTHIFENKSFLNFEDFLYYSNHNRVDKICIITSNKRFTKGHRKRVDFAQKIKEIFPDKVDIFGNGFNNIPDKFAIQSKYKYSIVIENCSYPNYWTEKLSDTYLAGSFPIYYGDPKIKDYFTDNEIRLININNIKESVQVIENILDEDVYNKSCAFLNEAKKKVLYKYNMFSIIASCLDMIQITEYSEKLVSFEPIKFSILDKIHQQIVRILN